MSGARLVVLVSAMALCVLGRAASEPLNPLAAAAPRPAFKEIWAYLMRGDEGGLTGTEPITDLCYFSVSLTKEGRITEAVARPVVNPTKGAAPRVHLVIDELSNDALMHFSLDPEYGVRPLLIGDILRVSEGFDGVQIDFESVSRDDAEYFIDFLKELRRSLPAGRILSVAVPARTRLIADAYDYARIAAIADKLIIMAYDEHWSASSPGPIASLPWCAKVADYALGAIARGKIVMGVPLYGRAWPDKRLSRAMRFKNIQELVAEKKSETNYSSDLGAWFEYSENVVVTVFYDDERSLLEKLNLYKARDIQSVSFWRIGLGPEAFWDIFEPPGSAIAPPRDGTFATPPLAPPPTDAIPIAPLTADPTSGAVPAPP
jgi:spore germination protein